MGQRLHKCLFWLQVCLMGQFCKCSDTQKAVMVFKTLNQSVRDSVSVSSIVIDKFTLTSVLSACTDAGLLYLGPTYTHLYILYGKCGRLQSASKIFKGSDIRNVVLWTSIISCYTSHGEGTETIRLFEMMVNEGIKSNEVTFVVVLTACSHTGLIDEGCMVDLLGRACRLNEIKGFIYENNISHMSVSVVGSHKGICRFYNTAGAYRSYNCF
ncbi:putative tetratricopeptide-like helical domain superfamily [Helianthus annuus]|nr:putative tetratricopeptide-like helical domain superfamily [Helianthus annuus]